MSSSETNKQKKTCLKIKGLEKSFGGIKVINDLSMECKVEEITALVGSNGAGKTTLFNLINGFLKPDEGDIYFYRDKKTVNLAKKSASETAECGVGRLFQDARPFPRLTALENVMLGFPKQSGEKLYRAMIPILRDYHQEKENREKALDLLDQVDVGFYAYRAVEELSFGQQKLVAFARLLAMDAKLLLLDEPSAGIDQKIQKSLRKLIRREAEKEGKTIILIEHNLDVVREMAHWVYLMGEGRMVDDGIPRKVLTRNRKEAIYV